MFPSESTKAWHQSLLLVVPAGGVFYVQLTGLQNAAVFEQAIPPKTKALHYDKVPAYKVHPAEASTHPAPLVIHPAKKLLQSELEVRVLGA